MLGHEVDVRLHSPDQTVSGTLNQQNATGVWIISYGVQKFYPMHRIIEIIDNGYRGR